MAEDQHNNLPRRKFLKLGIGSIGAIVGLTYISLLGDFLMPPAANAQTLQEVGKVADFKVGEPKFVSYKGSGVEEGIYVINQGSEGWLALDFHCTHLQCAINWVPATQQFICPCHGGVYDIKGNVLDGPPPKPLPRRIIKVQGDSVQVGGIST